MICDRDYPVWFAPNWLWNKVVRLPDGSDRWPFLCPTCFAMKAIEAGVKIVFELRPAPVIIEGDVFEHGVVCGCDCGCGKPLNDGNMMKQDITDDPGKPWEQGEPESPRVHLLLCSECFIGTHFGGANG